MQERRIDFQLFGPPCRAVQISIGVQLFLEAEPDADNHKLRE